MNQPIQPIQPVQTKAPQTSSGTKVAKPESVHLKSAITKNQMSKYLTWLVVIILFAGVGFGGYYVYKLINYHPTVQNESVKLNVDSNVQNELRSTTHYGDSISPAEGGVGRADPFASY